jgi:hypothetical protein
MKKLKQIIDWLEGKKRNIGILALTLLNGVTLFFPDAIPADKAKWLGDAINIALIGGLVDAVRKTDTGKSIIQKTVNKFKK